METSFILWLEKRDPALYAATEAELISIAEGFWSDKDKVRAGWDKRGKTLRDMATKLGISVTALLTMLYGAKSMWPDSKPTPEKPSVVATVKAPDVVEEENVTMYPGSDIDIIRREALRNKVWDIRGYQDPKTGHFRGLIVRFDEPDTSTASMGGEGSEKFEEIYRSTVRTAKQRLFNSTNSSYRSQWPAGAPKRIYWIEKGSTNREGMRSFIFFMPSEPVK